MKELKKAIRLMRKAIRLMRKAIRSLRIAFRSLKKAIVNHEDRTVIGDLNKHRLEPPKR